MKQRVGLWAIVAVGLATACAKRADEAPSGAESAKRHNRIQSLIKRL